MSTPRKQISVNEARKAKKLRRKLRKEKARLGLAREEVKMDQAQFGRQIEALRAEGAGAKSSTSLRVPKDNKYLRMLVDPIGCEPDSYPDEFEGLSSTFKALINHEVQYPLTDVVSDGVTYGAGSFHVSLLPDLKYPMRFIGQVVGTQSLEGELDHNGNDTCIVPVRGIDSAAAPVRLPDDEKLILNPAVNYNVLCPLEFGGQSGVMQGNFPEEVWMFHGRDVSQNEFFGIPFDAGGSSVYNVTFTIVATGSATTVSAASVSFGGVGATINQAITGVGIYTVVIPVANQRTCTVPPGVGVRISHNGTGNMELSNLAIRTVSNVATKWTMIGRPIPDIETAILLYNQYRVVSQGLLCSYRGPTLNNAGLISSYLYRGGQVPTLLNFQAYETLSEVPGSYDGAINNGTYGIWQPFDTKAMQFRDQMKPVTEFPYLCISGRYTGGGGSIAAGALRIRSAINYECITKAQVVGQHPSRLDIFDEKTLAVAFMRDFPPVMENPLHLRAIGDLLRRAVRGTFRAADQAAQYYKRNSGWINPIAGAASSLLL